MIAEPITGLGRLGSADHVFKILRSHGMKQSLTSAVLAAAAEWRNRRSRGQKSFHRPANSSPTVPALSPSGSKNCLRAGYSSYPRSFGTAISRGRIGCPTWSLGSRSSRVSSASPSCKNRPTKMVESPAGIGCAFCSTCFWCPTSGVRSRGKRNWKFGRSGLNCGGSYSRWKTDGGCNHATGYPSAPGWNWSPRRCGSGNKEQGRFRNCGFRRTARQQGHRNSVEKVPAKVPANTVLKGLKRVKKNSGGGMLDSERKCFIIRVSAMP